MAFWKTLQVPESNEVREIQVVQMWEVRWLSRAGRSGDAELCSVRPELECFTEEDEAHAFKASVENALALLRYTGTGTTVTLTKAR
jgi:hypothetical protein